MTYNVGH